MSISRFGTPVSRGMFCYIRQVLKEVYPSRASSRRSCRSRSARGDTRQDDGFVARRYSLKHLPGCAAEGPALHDLVALSDQILAFRHPVRERPGNGRSFRDGPRSSLVTPGPWKTCLVEK